MVLSAPPDSRNASQSSLNNEKATLTSMLFQNNVASPSKRKLSQLPTQQEGTDEARDRPPECRASEEEEASLASLRRKEASTHICETNELLGKLNGAITCCETRISVLDDLCNHFDHNDRSLHDLEICSGAANILFQKLSFVTTLANCAKIGNLGESRIVSESSIEEIALISCALEMVYRANSLPVMKSFDAIGRPLVIILSSTLNDHWLSSGNEATITGDSLISERGDRVDCVQPAYCFYGAMVTKKIIRILRCFAKYTSAEDRLFMATQEPLRAALFKIIKREEEESRAAADALSITGFLAEEQNSKSARIFVGQLGFLDIVTEVAGKSSNTKTREQASFALMSLVNVRKRHLTSEQQTKVLASLLHLMKDPSKVIQKYSGATLFNLAYSEEYDKNLIFYESGVFLDVIVHILKSDPNSKSRSNAAWVLYYLCNSNNFDVIEAVVEYNGILETLSDAVCEDECSVKVPAAKALRAISERVDKHMECHSSLIEALVRASVSQRSPPDE